MTERQKNLVIVESPAKAKTIEKFLGQDFKVMSSYGHIRDLKKKDFGVDLKTFEPQYEIPDDKKKVVADLRAAAKKAETVWLASDEDREGEAISWHLAKVLKLDPEATNRIVFHEITKPAILSAIQAPRHIDLRLVDAQQARRVLDRLVGFKLSPILWRKVRPSLSAGRVQSVAVRLVVEREREIAAFQSEASFHVVALFTLPEAQGESVLLKAELRKNFKTKAEAQAYLEACKQAVFTVETVTKTPAKRKPAPPFTTSTLQQEAARKLGYPVALTMRLAQTLYEAGLITYMRTDSMNLSGLCLSACKEVINASMGQGYHKSRQYHTNALGAQEAHEAIRPTDMTAREIGGTKQAQRLYELIWKRTIACQMADAELERTTIEIAGTGLAEPFIATGEVVKFDGFLKVYRESSHEDEERAESGLLPPIEKGATLQRTEITATERFTQHPARYNEASLVHKLEELGIGRPSTYAPTISTIQQREYVVKEDRPGSKRKYNVLALRGEKLSDTTKTETYGAEKNKLFPTDVGLVVNDFLLHAFPEIMDYNFTAKVEKDFDQVAEGNEDWQELLRRFYSHFDPQVEKILQEKTSHKAGERELGTDPATGQPICVKIGRFGPMAQLGAAGEAEKPRFARLKPGQSIETITLEEALDLFKLPRTLGDFEGSAVVINVGRFGPYVMHEKKYVSIPKDQDPMTITLEEAETLIVEKRKEEAERHIKSFEEEPDLEVLKGRFGPYIAFQKKNYRLPKAVAERAAELTLEECRKIIAEENKKPTRATRRRTTKKT